MQKIFKIICLVMCLVIVVGSISLVGAVKKPVEFTFDPFGGKEVTEKIKNYEMNMTSVIYVKNDNGEWEEYHRLHGEENRIWVDIEKIPQHLIDAVISIEDERFLSHGGVDWKRTLSAFLNYLPFIEIYDSHHGGSTITQQLIKNIMDDRETSAKRKIREIARALYIDGKMSKNDILEAYLNTISLGNGICGVQVAANYYFNKDVSELTLIECASIAGITQNPSAYNPIDMPNGNKKRRKMVLDKMLELEKITKEEYDNCYDADITVDNTQQSNFEPEINNWFVDTLISDVSKDLSQKYGCSESVASTMLYNGGYKVYATVDPDIQFAMESVYTNVSRFFSQKSAKNKNEHVQSAMTLMDYEGHIIGIVGGTGEKTTNRGLNRATDSPRHPGSAMKPLGAYAPAIDSGVITYSTVIEDKPIDDFYGRGKDGPNNSYSGFYGKMSMLKALEISSNTVACRVIVDHLGIDSSFDFLTQKLRLSYLTEIDKNPSSLALGGCDYGITTTQAAAAYAIFGNGGKYYEPVTYYTVERSNGEIVLDSKTEGEQVIKPATASIMNRLLQNVVYGSSGTARAVSWYSTMKAFAKTGTSSDYHDRWLVGGSPYYVASVWCGFDNPEWVSSSMSPSTVWRTVMSDIHKGLEKKSFPECEEVKTAKYCTSTGLRASKSCTSTATGYYVPELLPKYCSGKHGGSAAAVPPAQTPSTPATPTPPTTSTTPPAEESKPQTGDTTTGSDNNSGEGGGTDNGEGSSGNSGQGTTQEPATGDQ